jgi:hypothetical protein
MNGNTDESGEFGACTTEGRRNISQFDEPTEKNPTELCPSRAVPDRIQHPIDRFRVDQPIELAEPDPRGSDHP